MNIEELREFCLSFPATDEGFPFDNETLVFKVKEKLFCLTNVDHFASINLKCDPEKAVQQREQYPAVQPGYHMNKRHWNTVMMDGSIPNDLVREWITDSYRLVVKSLPKREREGLDKI
jgi:predicted DNA-binding protein (MmcQ/YjbR family)